MLMRLFIGIALADDVRAALDGKIRDLKRTGAPVRWCAPETIHLTLKFIGACDPATSEAVTRVLEDERLRVGPLPLRISGLGRFGRGGEARVVWAGVEPLPALNELHAGIESLLVPLGLAREERPFSPHLTLGRGKGGDCRALLARLAEPEETAMAAATTATAFQLFESRLTPQGPVHTVLREYPLG
jgi:RNA 2',3'-cyclic 3'-phosphodiesterase